MTLVSVDQVHIVSSFPLGFPWEGRSGDLLGFLISVSRVFEAASKSE